MIEYKYRSIPANNYSFLLKKVKELSDELVDYKIESNIIDGMYNERKKASIVATVKHYPILFKILNIEFNPTTILSYLNNETLRPSIPLVYIRKIHHELENTIHQSDNNQCKYNYDSNIDTAIKLEIVKKYILGLNFKLVNKKTIKDYKKAKKFLNKMDNHEQCDILIRQIDDKIIQSKKNTKDFCELMQLLNLEKENLLVKKRI